MKKQDLYDLINKRYAERVEILQEKYREKAKFYSNKVLENYKTDFNAIDEAVDNLKNIAAPTDFNRLFQYYGGFTGDLTNIIGRGSYHNYITNAIIQKYAHLTNIYIQDYTPDFDKAVDKAFNQKIVVPYQKEIEEAKTLVKELNSIVRLYSAKQAAKRLEELGLDLSDLEEIAVQSLPAVIKTSVNVCIFNKEGC